ncbi:MAG: 2,3-dihydroxybiphenyl 1,2-dioxygenase [bacterium]|nr:2,3-dihydroxybiphenyl 1,2-dioxygenase [Deltaproteobacteria bacterium]MCP4904168.1 2,3-dihydroxybiphenyl 1,2-dioxygenase [bacterium]
MSIRTLGYVVIETCDLDAWRRFACDTLGLMATPAPDGGDAIHLRLDDRPVRIRVERSDREGLVAAGWEVADSDAFESFIAALKAADVDVEIASDELCAARGARGVARFRDPGDNPHELFYGTIYDHQPFISPVGCSGFQTADLGMGHVVLPMMDMAAGREFFKNVLGFRVSDTLEGPVSLAFLRCNPRHHSLAIASLPHPTGLVHFMLELKTLEDVGRALDRVRAAGLHLSATLGMHTNDRMVSFYVRSPSGFDVEVGCHGIRVDEATWTTGEITAPSFWGHHWDFGKGESSE